MPRRAVYTVTGFTVGAALWIGGTVAAELPGQYRSDTPNFLWVADWGNALGDVPVNALLTYTTVALVLYGISLGGQAAFESARHRHRIRQGVGLIGVLLAGSALALAVFATAAAFTTPDRIPVLLVILPTAGICYTLGVEVGRFIVPSHHEQLDAAKQAKIDTQARLSRLPRRASGRWLYQATPIWYGILAGVATGLVVEKTVGDGFGVAFLFGAVGVSAGLFMLLQIGAGTIEDRSHKRRFATRGMAFVFYALMVIFTNGPLSAMAPRASFGLLILVIVESCIPILSYRAFAPRREWLLKLSLAGAISRFAYNDLARSLDITTRRIRDLEKLQGQEVAKTWRDRLILLGAAIRP